MGLMSFYGPEMDAVINAAPGGQKGGEMSADSLAKDRDNYYTRTMRIATHIA